MIKKIYAASRHRQMLFVGALALRVSPWAVGQAAPPAAPAGSLNLQLPSPPADAIPRAGSHEPGQRNGKSAGISLLRTPVTRENVSPLSSTDADADRRPYISAADRQLQDHQNMFNRSSACPLPFDTPQAPVTSPSNSQLEFKR
ncbi:hypothetical protein [Dyella sp. 2RAB6]|uniref:hypothetical protein n=1 Tax=Dyella sp. 2RAB6 TaxID=3232992 RepID=UPI003F8E819B